MSSNLFIRYVGVLLIVVIQAPTATAQPIYRSTASSGSTVYTSKPSQKGATPADLPSITRENTQRKVIARSTCASRGGINCGAGADADGSVICNDGSKNSDERFNFTCRAPKLSADAITPRDGGGFSVFVRNVGPAVAKGVVVTFAPESAEKIALTGPNEIKEFESGEYVYTPRIASQNVPAPKAGDISVSCSTCNS